MCLVTWFSSVVDTQGSWSVRVVNGGRESHVFSRVVQFCDRYSGFVECSCGEWRA